MRDTVLVEVVGVEAVARGEVGLAGGDGGALVQDVLVRGVVGADLGVEGAGEELGTHPVVGGVDGLAVAGLGGAPGGASGSCNSGGRRGRGGLDNGGRGSGGRKDRRDSDGSGGSGVVNSVNNDRRESDVGSIVSVGTGNNDLEILAPATLVGGRHSVQVGSPKGALVVGDGRGVRAPVSPDGGVSRVVLGRVLRRVTLNVNVERSAKRGAVAVGSAVRDIVSRQSVQTEVRVGAGRGVQVTEGLLVGVAGDVVAGDNGRGSGGHRVEGSVGEESRGSVGVVDLGTVTIGLRSARVLRVDEATVSAILGGGRAGSGRRGGRSARRSSVDGG